MSGINRLLCREGRAVLEFPNIEAADKRLKRLLVRSGLDKRKFRADFAAGHCNELCGRSFEHLLSRTGLELVRWETYSSKSFSDFVYNRAHIGNKARALIRKNSEPPT